MKSFTFLLVAVLAIAGSAYAQSDTSATTAAQGTYPTGTSFNGISINALQIATGTLIMGGGTAEGHVTVGLIAPSILGAPPQTITIEVEVTGGSLAAANVVTLSGTCSVDMGTGAPPLTGVPFVATIATNDQHLGTVGLVIGTSALPNATIGDGSMSIDALTQ
jgi:hypothetical protein